MANSDFKLIKKILLTKDVFKLVFETSSNLNSIPGQFITFLLPKTKFARAYSILNQEGNNFNFIIKRLENGRGGSREICDLEIGEDLKGVGPVGHFLLKETQNNKLFIGTGTGMVPFYNQILNLSLKKPSFNYKLILGNRSSEDLYFLEELDSLKSDKFDYEVYLSQEKTEKYNYGRVSDFLVQENISKFQEFYICGNPNMIDDVIEKLILSGVSQENIFTEKY